MYGPSKSIDRSIFWNELTILQQHCLPYWLLAGDFNIFRWKSETNAKNLDTRNMAFFNDFIQANELIDPPLTNNNFTWSNLRINPTFSHLDRFLYIPQEHFRELSRIIYPLFWYLHKLHGVLAPSDSLTTLYKTKISRKTCKAGGSILSKNVTLATFLYTASKHCQSTSKNGKAKDQINLRQTKKFSRQKLN